MPAIAESPAAGVLDSWNQAMTEHSLNPADASVEMTQPTPTPEPVETKPEPVVEKPQSDVPDEFIEPKTDAPKEDAKVEPDSDPDLLNFQTTLSGKAREQFQRQQDQANLVIKRVKTEAETLKQKLAELESRSAQPADTEKTVAELKAERQKREEYEELLAKVAVERSPAFKEKFIDREAMIADRAKGILKDLGADEGLFDQLANASAKKRLEILDGSELSASAQTLLAAQLARYDEISSEKAAFLSKSKTEYEAWESNNRMQSEKARIDAEAREAQIFNARLEKAKSEWIELRRVEGNSEWNAGAEAAEEEARQFFSGKMPIDAVADIALAGVIQKRTALILKRTQERLRSAQQRIADMETAGPGVTARTTGAKPSATGSPSETFDRIMAEHGLR